MQFVKPFFALCEYFYNFKVRFNECLREGNRFPKGRTECTVKNKNALICSAPRRHLRTCGKQGRIRYGSFFFFTKRFLRPFSSSRKVSMSLNSR